MGYLKYIESFDKTKTWQENWYVVGIDLGTTHSVISYWENNSKSILTLDLSNGFGKAPMPSVVQYRKYDREEEWVIGEEAYRALRIYPESTVRSIKRKMGTNETVKLGGSLYLPEQISAMIIKQLLHHVEQINPKMELAGCVVSVPYGFDDAAKKATIKACELAGIGDQLICLIEEPKAAALAYHFRHPLITNENILVFDFGGGTLDITVFNVSQKGKNNVKLKVISEGGDAFHGGDTVDELLLNHFKEVLIEKNQIEYKSLTSEQQAELMMRTIEAKERLSGVKKYRMPFTFMVPPFVLPLDRDQFENVIQSFIHKTKHFVEKVLREAYNGPLLPSDIHKVLLEGGTSLMPWVKQMLVQIFNDEQLIYHSESPALDISIGAATYAAMKMGLIKQQNFDAQDQEIEFEVTIPHDIGFKIDYGDKVDFYKMISRGTPYALAKKSHIFTLSGVSEEDMTHLKLTILERLNKEDTVNECKLIGEVIVQGLPKRPAGKTKLSVSLSVIEEGGMVVGYIEDLGYGEEYPRSGFKASFDPHRYENTLLQ